MNKGWEDCLLTSWLYWKGSNPCQDGSRHDTLTSLETPTVGYYTSLDVSRFIYVRYLWNPVLFQRELFQKDTKGSQELEETDVLIVRGYRWLKLETLLLLS